jgi:Cu2+-exporting ATPase/Cu+-exporting ATPase
MRKIEGSDYSFLNQSEFRGRYGFGAEKNRIRFYIDGISCGKCIRRLEDLTLTLPGLLQFRVELASHVGEAVVDPNVLGFDKLAEAIQDRGYSPIPIGPEREVDELRRTEDRRELIRLGVAAACAGNIMTFSFANYFGADPEFASYFAWLSFVLYLPVLTYVAVPFYRGAWKSLKNGLVSIDLPMAVASLTGFAFSTIELARGKSDIYFDSLSGFLFLILLSRWTQKRLQRKFLRPQALLESLHLQKARVIGESGWAWRSEENLKPGDRILLCSSEVLPAEAELVSSTAHFSLAWLSGESRPKTFLRGALIPAGAKLLSGEVQLRARRPLKETPFGRILDEVQNSSLASTTSVNDADRWAQWLLRTVFAVALVFVAVYWTVSPEEAVRRSLALLILACPCAMAFGTPLAVARALRRSRAQGMIVRNPDVFEKCNGIEEVFFDKTGTLTDSELTLKNPEDLTPAVYQKVILALENESLHPIAFAFRRAFGERLNLPAVEGLKEIPGVGVSGFIFGKSYELKANTKSPFATNCTLFEDQSPIRDYEFETTLRPHSREILDWLRGRGLKVHLLSGDSVEATRVLAGQLGFTPENVRARLSPEDKEALVSRSAHAMMVGDGVNDALAIIRAEIGVAVSGGMEAALKSADVYLSEPGIESLRKIFEISAECRKLIRRNLMLSAVYNFIGGTLALSGMINPFVAALLMPLSSGIILLNTSYGAESE